MSAQADALVGLRHDAGKPRTDLLPPDALLELARLYGDAVREYPERNWELGMRWGRVLGPLLRHLFAWMRGEDVDPKSGHLHLTHVAWNAMALLTYQLRNIGEDDRSKG